MGVYTKLADDLAEVDVIIAGGGTAACVVAGRLAEADPELSILLIEGGPNNYKVPNIVHPVFFLDHLLPTSKTTIFYKGNKAKQLADREVIVPSGGTLGGGSSINFMMYTRGQRSDFDSWKSSGWSADDLLPYMKKLENYHGQGGNDHHGYDGPVHISDSTYRSRGSQDDFLSAAAKVGWTEITDLQTLDANNGFERWQNYISEDGKRQDTAHKYVHEKLQSGNFPNLHVLVESKVVRVLFDNDKQAVGVEYTPNPDFQPALQTPQHPKLTIRARRQVIVSCGACGTPPVLERSGLGDPEILKKAGVPVVVDLPGVGRNYQDHHLSLYPYRTSLQPHETIDRVLRNPGNRQKLIDDKDNILGWNSIDISSKLRPSEEDVAGFDPEFQAAWNRDYKNSPDRPLMLMGVVSCFLGDPSSVPEAQYVTVGNYTAYPYSRGHMHITGPELSDSLDFDVGFFSDPHDIDVKKQIWAYKKHREIMRRTSMYRGELAPGHPAFPEGSAAACIEAEAPLSNVEDLKYSPEDDVAIEKWLRENIGTTWHSLGTAKMAPREEGGVVNESLDVWGTKRLKIADLSIPPMNVGANTNNTAIVVGEKAAAILIQELGLHK
ncbi:GMC oxidoreductase-domain-containing protein [Dactylonectria macrodidyma]|uniref:GMC oxidoreductase-domain-containing protein n=1 Tax=Dactylonectria macrodidyma TaxID=307937 RepID=A0A9P9EQH9_9HYPO|nr:GMC oxidoreductase-domain-containing protein [Dactylonectria macrodidyma]